MGPFIGSEAIARQALTPYQLRSRYQAVYPDIYTSPGMELSAIQCAYGAWLWSKRRAIVAGQSASAIHGANWVDSRRPAELQYGNRHCPKGIVIWSDHLAPEETQLIRGIPVTIPARTAFDLAGRYPLVQVVAAIHALARATKLKTTEVQALAERYRGHRNIRRARHALTLVDPGAQSPKETWLRLLVIEAGYPPPQTQMPIYGRYGELVGVVDMGWQAIQLALEYEGAQHRNGSQFTKDIARYETMTTDLGWIVLRVTDQDTPGGILGRLATAWAKRALEPIPARSA